MKILFCIYTCAQDEPLLRLLEETGLFSYVASADNITTRKVFASPKIDKAELSSGAIIVPCEEEYSKLSLKTYYMLSAALQIEFDFIVKCDSTLAGYAAKKHTKNEAMMAALSPQKALSTLKDGSFFDFAYNGLLYQTADEYNFTNWARIKNIPCDYRAVFPQGEKTPPYFLGKFYSLRRDVCEFISQNGYSMAADHSQYLGGSEDLFVGRQYNDWLRRQNIATPQTLPFI